VTGLRDVLDSALEVPVVPSFTLVGPVVRSRLDGWRPLGSYDLTGRVVVLTGPTSGLGLAAAEQLSRCGATLVLVGRDRARTEAVTRRLAELPGSPAPAPAADVVVADLGDLDAVRAAAVEISHRYPRVDVLLHNAGALSPTRSVTSAGLEATVASQVVGPFLLTALLLPSLRAAAPGRVITMSSGGLYATGLTVQGLQMGERDYRGAEQYARAKRAQVTLTQTWAQTVPADEVVFHSVHPGWADTPGVRTSLPTFRRVTGPLLRTPAQGADTMVWLAADDGAPLRWSGLFWLDRRPRSLHRLPATRRSDTPERRDELWRWVVRQGSVPDPRG
jgi:NAD(P)-dependent dehydrogenase (short-subunit alcohol dehydrogenase family)